jgi:hypothetical protein
MLPASRKLRFKKVCMNGFLSGTVSVSASIGRAATRKAGEVCLWGVPLRHDYEQPGKETSSRISATLAVQVVPSLWTTTEFLTLQAL